MHIFYNGDTIDDVTLEVSHNNRAFMYGDGLFETIISQAYQMKFEQSHKERLLAGMKAMNLVFSEKLTIDSVFTGIGKLVRKSGLQSARIRLQVWRISGGFYAPEGNASHVLATCIPYEINRGLPKKKVGFSNTVRLAETNWSTFKTISATPYVQAGIEKSQRKLDDLILSDQHGHVSECTSSNLFWKKKDVCYTPSLRTGCISGIRRKHIIEQLKKHKTPLHIGEYFPAELLEADEVFSCNVTGIQPILSIDDHHFNSNISIKPQWEL